MRNEPPVLKSQRVAVARWRFARLCESVFMFARQLRKDMNCFPAHRGPYLLAWRKEPATIGNMIKTRTWKCGHCGRKYQ